MNSKTVSVILSLVFLLALILAFRGLISNYYPASDGFSLIVNSTPYAKEVDFTEWVTSGFSNYFYTYPEFSAPYTNFIRPVINLSYYLNYVLWRTSWGRYLYLNYLILAISGGLSFYLAKNFLDCSSIVSCLAAAIVLVNPSTPDVFCCPSCIADAMAALFCAIAFLLVVRQRFLPAIILLTIAMFTKETIAFAPIASAITLLTVRYNKLKHFAINDFLQAALIIAVPLGIWGLIRHLAFHGVTGAYVTNSLTVKTVFYNFAKFFMQWPLGLQVPIDPARSIRAIFSRQWNEISPPALLAIAINLTAASGILWFLVRSLPNPEWRKQNRNVLLLLPWVLGILLTIVALGLSPRFGSFFYLIGVPLFLSTFLNRDRSRNKIAICFAVPILAVLILPSMNFIQKVHGTRWIEDYVKSGTLAKSLVKTLYRSGQKYEKIYVVNDIPSRFGGGFVGSFAKSQAPVTILSSLKCDSIPENSVVSVEIQDKGNGITLITTRISNGCEFWFPGVNMELRIGNRVIPRNKHIKYEFPEYRPPTYGLLGKQSHLGNVLVVELSDPSRYAIVYYDNTKREYAVASDLPADCRK